MSAVATPPISPASLTAYFTGLVSFLLSDLTSALHSLPTYNSIKQSTKTPPEIYEILRQSTATWTELRKVLQVDRILLGSLTQSCTLKDGVIGVSVFSVKGGDGWLGMACTSGGWQLVEILAYLGRLRDRVELAVAEAAAHEGRKPRLTTPRVPPPPLPQYSPPQVPTPHDNDSPPVETQDQPRYALPNPYEARQAIGSASTSNVDDTIVEAPPAEQVSRSKTSAKVRARAEDKEEPVFKKKRGRGRPSKPKPVVVPPPPPPAVDPVAVAGPSEASLSTLILEMASTTSNLGKATESTEAKTSTVGEDSPIANFAPPLPPPPLATASTSRYTSPLVDQVVSSATFSPPKPAPDEIPAPSSSQPSPPHAPTNIAYDSALGPPPIQDGALSPVISPVARFASPRRRFSVDPQVNLKGEVYVPTTRESMTDRPKRERKLPERIKIECGIDDEDESGDESGRERKKIKTFSEIEKGEDSEMSVGSSEGSSLTASAKKTERKRWIVGETAFVRFPNYSWWIATILDPSTAPPETQGRQIRGSYLVKSIPTGADHRWISPDENSIRPIEEEELRQIEESDYAEKQVPQSWKKWRIDLLDAVGIVKDPERLKEWQSRKTDLEVRIEAEKERRKASRQMNASW